MSEVAKELTKFQQADAIMSKTPIKRLRAIERRFDDKYEKLVDSQLNLLVIYANEYTRTINGHQDEWDRWEDMSLEELTEYLEVERSDDADKSDQPTE